MNIAIDCTFFGHEEAQKKHLSLSTSIFTADILDAFVRLGLSANFTLIVNYNHEAFFRQRFPEYRLCILRFFPLTLACRLTGGRFKGTKYLKKLGFFKHAVEHGGFDKIWFPYAMNRTFVRTNLPALASIHDIYRIHHGTKSEAEAFISFLNDGTTQLTSVSEYTKNDIQKTTDCKKEITVIPNSIVFDVSRQKELSQLADKKYILDLNAYIEKKNPMTLLKAFNLIKDRTDSHLVFCGGYKDDHLFAEMQNYIEENGLKERVSLLFRVSDEERNWLLTHAALFVTPSIFEGFGRTPVEAAICRVPVISTKETSLFEATMGLCSYVENATDEQEFAKQIVSKIESPDLQEKLEQISAALKNNYEPERLAKKYWEIFESIPHFS